MEDLSIVLTEVGFDYAARRTDRPESPVAARLHRMRAQRRRCQEEESFMARLNLPIADYVRT